MAFKRFGVRRWHKILIGASCFFVILGFMLLSVDFVALNKNFYARQFNKNDTANELSLSQSELEKVRDRLIAYFSGRADSLQISVTFDGKEEAEPFYTDDELSHMDDVKKVFGGFRAAAVILLILGISGLIAFGVFLKLDGFLQASSNGAIGACIAFVGIFAVLGILVAALFDVLFGYFHEIFFPQGNWQFSWDSNMLGMLPETLFMDAAINIVIYGISGAIVFLLAGITIKLVKKYGSKKPETVKDAENAE